jgi:predicted naringenin-chalcone synthase
MSFVMSVAAECQNDFGVGQSAIVKPSIAGLGTANPDVSYSQSEVLDLLKIEDRRVRSLFLNGAIDRRHLVLPLADANQSRRDETQGELLRKHRVTAVDIGSRAIRACLENIAANVSDVGYICCVTTTGFLSPGLSAFISRELGLAHHCGRLDVVGMGCNAGLNALNATAGWATANRGKIAIMLCVEICSAGYVLDGSMRSGVVNSLFGDGAAAAAIVAEEERGPQSMKRGGNQSMKPSILKFNSCLITSAIDAMRYDWDDVHGKFSFYIDSEVPYVIGAHAEETINSLLSGTGLRRSEIRHWLVHSGGKKVIDAVRVNLGLAPHDLRHTTSVLHDYGNLSSGSFLFSYQRLLDEHVVQPGDYGIMMTMGPGSTIETALLRW